MKIRRPTFPQALLSIATLSVIAVSASAQQPAPQQAAARFDITNYRIEAQLIPDQHMLRAGADITLIPLEATRSLVFELNGSLKVESIDRDGQAADGLCAGRGRRRLAWAKCQGRSRTGGAGESTDDASFSLERRADFAGRWTAGDQAARVCRPGRLLSDVRLALVSLSRLRRGSRHV